MAVGDANEGGAVGLDVVGDIVASTGMEVRNNVTDGESDGLVVGLLVVGDTVASTGIAVGDADEGFAVGDIVGFFTGIPVGAMDIVAALIKHSFRLFSTGAQYWSASHPRQLIDPSRLTSHSLH